MNALQLRHYNRAFLAVGAVRGKRSRCGRDKHFHTHTNFALTTRAYRRLESYIAAWSTDMVLIKVILDFLS
jgi:hypothetical protein